MVNAWTNCANYSVGILGMLDYSAQADSGRQCLSDVQGRQTRIHSPGTVLCC